MCGGRQTGEMYAAPENQCYVYLAKMDLWLTASSLFNMMGRSHHALVNYDGRS